MQNRRNCLYRKQWTIFMRKQWTVLINAKNRFYECGKQLRSAITAPMLKTIYAEKSDQFLWENSEQF